MTAKSKDVKAPEASELDNLDEPLALADGDLVELTVAPRRSVVGHTGRAVGPGKPVMVPAADVEWLMERGFVEADGGVLVAKGPATLAER